MTVYFFVIKDYLEYCILDMIEELFRSRSAMWNSKFRWFLFLFSWGVFTRKCSFLITTSLNRHGAPGDKNTPETY